MGPPGSASRVSTDMKQTATLFRARRTAWRNASHSSQGVFRPVVLGATLLGLGAIAVVGELSVASLLGAPVDTATPAFGRRLPVRGDAALEAAFWLSALLCSFLAFRVMESLFRSPNIRALELLPVRPGPILAERTANAALEATGFAVALSAFFLPLSWHGEPLLSALCATMVLGATLCTAGITIGTNAWFGAQYGGSSKIGDSYGSQGGAFIYAPMVSLAMSVVCIMMLQLGTREVLHSAKITNAFWLATGVAATIAAWTLLVGARHFVASYHRVAAFFREADEVGFRAVMDYQQSTWVPARLEALAGDGRWVFRRHTLQFPRRFPVARSVVALGAIGAAIGAGLLSTSAYPSWVVALTPAALFALLERPFTRVFDERLGGDGDVLMPIAPQTLEHATTVWWFYEIGRIALPYALITGVVRGFTVSATEGALVAVTGAAASLALPTVVAVSRKLGLRSIAATHSVALLTIVVCASTAAANLVFGAVAASAIVVAGQLSNVAVRRR